MWDNHHTERQVYTSLPPPIILLDGMDTKARRLTLDTGEIVLKVARQHLDDDPRISRGRKLPLNQAGQRGEKLLLRKRW